MRNRGFEIVSDFKDKYINLPTRKTSKSAGYDIEAAEDKIIKAGQMAVIATGLKAYMQDDEYLGIHIRSSLAFKKNLNLVNSHVCVFVATEILSGVEILATSSADTKPAPTCKLYKAVA